jgi:ABC-type uncharacterized transport system substrate-binding protein
VTFRAVLEQLGWSEGRNLQIEDRWAGADVGRIAQSARELVELRPDALLTRTTPAIVAAAHATGTIPIVFLILSDPVGGWAGREHCASGW